MNFCSFDDRLDLAVRWDLFYFTRTVCCPLSFKKSIGADFLMGHTISRHARMLGKRLLLGFTVASHPPRPLQGRNFYKCSLLKPAATGIGLFPIHKSYHMRSAMQAHNYVFLSIFLPKKREGKGKPIAIQARALNRQLS